MLKKVVLLNIFVEIFFFFFECCKGQHLFEMENIWYHYKRLYCLFWSI